MPPIVRTPKVRLERDVVQEIRLALGLVPGLVLWRNQVAHLESWDPERGCKVHVQAGLAVGSADLIGIYRGRFVALEVKKPKTGRQSDEQKQWADLVRSVGGFYAVVRSAEEAKAAIDLAFGG